MPAILAASDLSSRGDRAIARALRLGAAMALPVRIITAVDDDLPGALLARRLTEAEAALDRVLAGLSRAPGQVISRAALPGEPSSVIPAAAHAEHATLVVLGLHRPRPFLDLLRETTMERLVRMIRRPVILARDPADRDYARVLSPVSFSPACSAALAAARMVAPGAEIHAFHALHIPYAGLTGEGTEGPMARALTAETETARAAWALAAPLPEGVAMPQILPGGFGQILQAEIDRFRPDLLAMGAHTRSGWVPNGLGGTVAQTIRNPPCDVMVARPEGVAL